MMMILGIWGQPDMNTLTPTDTIPLMSSRNFRGKVYDLSEILGVVFSPLLPEGHHATSRWTSQQAALSTRHKHQTVIEPGVQRASSSNVFRPGNSACMTISQQSTRR